ncbi:imidazole glycerol phosphate synthase subunit HisH [Legionella sp. MW5194]|uniref:imidazole glycerol phosphate synthase subunit HisH n=1 Tax=Legionella sp. MW5194 TaxID=2662448 RepID=UPI00193DB2B1|nr:imidazole glycerol phosphate synthase subunit HisH [Legionella sp. MW5194]QRN03641.1 imidazole glycerol phosphate synthase subunit HisH [Legionella sp. MW5194]
MIAVIDATGNNLTSLGNALTRLGYDYRLTHDQAVIADASHVILPGVGAAKAAMQALADKGLIAPLRQLKQPLLGICLGMQLLFEHSEEGDVEGLGVLPGRIKRLPVKDDCPVPHMGWNKLHWCRDTPLATGLTPQDYVYFVHGYALFDSECAAAYCHYSERFTAVVQRGTVFGMQFHPEKSARAGLTLLSNFLQMES